MSAHLKGIGASPGVSIGKVLVLLKSEIEIETTNIAPADAPAEMKKFEDAINASKQQIKAIMQKAKETLGSRKAGIFNAHLDVLDDPSLVDSMADKINHKFMNAGWALNESVNEITALFEMIDDEYLKERAADVRDVCSRVALNIAGAKIIDLSSLDENVVIIAKDLLPSDTASMDLEKVLGFATDMGGRTSHTSIMARSLEIPAAVGLTNISASVKDGQMIIVDGSTGDVIIEPTDEEIKKYQEKQKVFEQEREFLARLKELKAETKDGKVVELCSNIGGLQDCKGALANGAEGIGLFRTEFLYMNSKKNFPTEKEQFDAYKAVAEKMEGKPVIIRTLDIGGDKELSYYKFEPELNPFLGWRAIRICLDKVDVFKTQLRAILRASAFGKLRVMFPMIISIEEFRKAKAILDECKADLKKVNIAFDENIEVGIMVETPAAVVLAEYFAEIVDFFSIGTNDLTQYTLAVDRGNENIAHLYNSYHPAVIKSIKKVIDASHKCGKWTGMCGEFAGEKKAAVLLLGLGLDEFSMSSISIPHIKNLVRELNYSDAKKLADEVLEARTSDETIAILDKHLHNLLP